ncbi:CRISPR-associated protein Csx10 [Leptolyngbya valderiana BDU 20041]|nr:CRISPR-associated protein Csx10 [Leptolyngbya valderiana BDU 20041]
MKEIRLKITAKSPLAIGWRKPGSVSEAAEFISGSVIRGAVASQMLRLANGDSPEPGDDFHRLFVDEDAAVFCNGYPATTKDKENDNSQKNSNRNEIAIEVEDVRVLPATVVSAKASDGFKPKGNGVFDTLIDRFCAEECGQLYDPNDPQDGKRVEPYSGFYGKYQGRYVKLSVSKRLLTRVGMNRSRATSEDEILYSIEVLNEKFATQHKQEVNARELKQWHNVIYRSSIFVEDEDMAQGLAYFINTHSREFRLGGSASRGLGCVKIEATCVEVNLENSVKNRIKKFNEIFQERREDWQALFQGKPISNSQIYLTLDLQSDGIFIDDWKRTIVVTPSMLCQFAGIEDESLELHAAYSSYNYVSGWNSAWGLMKDIDLVTMKGSVYLFSTEEIDRWYEPLARLECRGIGERTLEGFGQIEVCNEFHQVFREDAA